LRLQRQCRWSQAASRISEPSRYFSWNPLIHSIHLSVSSEHLTI
jgi:hypothetical protein